MQSCAKFRIVTEQNTQFNDVIVSNKKKLREWQKILYQAFIFIYIQTHAFWVCCFSPIFLVAALGSKFKKVKFFKCNEPCWSTAAAAAVAFYCMVSRHTTI